mmetsp:Transcript_21740/g.54757  ORF Transcript_21740/g.54757 Transcript_21740/m.54757 type:complete len:224 (-) Transcript_21740:223-894(-)
MRGPMVPLARPAYAACLRRHHLCQPRCALVHRTDNRLRLLVLPDGLLVGGARHNVLQHGPHDLMLFLEVLQRLRTHVRSGCEQLITQRWIHLGEVGVHVAHQAIVVLNHAVLQKPVVHVDHRGAVEQRAVECLRVALHRAHRLQNLVRGLWAQLFGGNNPRDALIVAGSSKHCVSDGCHASELVPRGDGVGAGVVVAAEGVLHVKSPSAPGCSPGHRRAPSAP